MVIMMIRAMRSMSKVGSRELLMLSRLMVHPGRRWCSPVRRMAARVEVTARFTRVHMTWGMVSGNIVSSVEGERVTGDGAYV